MNKKISELLETIDLNDEDILMILQSGQNKKIKAINALKNINKSLSDLNTTKLEKTIYVSEIGTDLNNYKTDGVYYFSSAAKPTNIPAGSNGWLQVYSSNQNSVKQIWYRYGTPNSNDFETYVRTKDGSDNWSEWSQYEIVSDSGWKTASLTADFKPYQDNINYTPKYRKIGKVVHIVGVVKPAKTISATSNSVTIFTLPPEYKPSIPTYTLCQGSGNNKWLLTVSDNGNVGFSRYGVDKNVDVTESTWLPFNITYMVD